MKLFTIVAFAVLQLLDSTRAASIPKHQLKAPVYSKGQRSPEELGGHYEGDMVKSGKLQNGLLNTASRWPNKTVPYCIEDRFIASDRALILAAMKEIMDTTCIKFVPKNETTKDYVHFRSLNNSGCSSYVGRIGGMQYITLLSSTDSPNGNCFVVGNGTVVHEILHALGFVHMQSSFDRDNFVTINTTNIITGYEGNFRKETDTTVGYYGTSYDYGSIMHYGRNYFSSNGKDTITTKTASAQTLIGQRSRISVGDIARVNKMYSC